MRNCSHLYAVTQEGKCLVVRFTDRRIKNTGTMISKIKKAGFTKLAVVYCGRTSVSTGFSAWNGKDNGIFEQYLADATIGKTNQHCIDNIIANASAYDFTNGELISY